MSKSLAIQRLHTRSRLQQSYDSFDQLDGTHPLQQAVPESCVMYDVRVLPGGKVTYFNWSLAKEMGLVAPNHSERVNRSLEQKILETFCIRIINEWDLEHHIQVPRGTLKKNKYMATRYLQLQHSDKAGRTSGDGRCIWNGCVTHKNVVWDVSSRGTGVTSLAPGAVLAGKPLRSGNTDHGYGCGMAEIDELYAAAIMAEIFHQNGIATERMLTIIDLGKGVGIGVRAGQNLLRPAHLFSHLRQNQLSRLSRSVDYLIDRQHQNKIWKFNSRHKRKYNLFLEETSKSFAKFAATLERDYIFAWLDWDGDNVLVSSGIIDYGSVRQFGLRHDQYRYDDQDRFSTNLNEQRLKARGIVQTFAQLTDWLQTGSKKPLGRFKNHVSVKLFDSEYESHLLDRFLFQVGFSTAQRERLFTHHHAEVKKLFKECSAIEKIKTYKKMRRVADGINRPAIFNMRIVLGLLPSFYVSHRTKSGYELMASRDLFIAMLSDFAEGRDKRMTSRLSRKLTRLQNLYLSLVRKASNRADSYLVMLDISRRAAKRNRQDRLTGNALIHVVDELLRARKKGYSDILIQEVMAAIIADQSMTSEAPPAMPLMLTSSPTFQLFEQVRGLVRDHQEDI